MAGGTISISKAKARAAEWLIGITSFQTRILGQSGDLLFYLVNQSEKEDQESQSPRDLPLNPSPLAFVRFSSPATPDVSGNETCPSRPKGPGPSDELAHLGLSSK